MGIGERIKDARKKAGISQAGLAKLVGRSQSAVAEWETGETAPRRNIVETVAQALGVSALWLEVGGVHDTDRLYENPPKDFTPVKTPPIASGSGPVFASSLADNGATLLDIANTIERRAKPSRWANVKDLFAFYIISDTMTPRINPGELVWTHPHRRPSPEQEAIFIRRTAGKTQREIMLMIYAGQTNAKWLVRQLNPKKEFDLKKADWDCQLVVDIDLNR